MILLQQYATRQEPFIITNLGTLPFGPYDFDLYSLELDVIDMRSELIFLCPVDFNGSFPLVLIKT
jgi:hypothetical protein